MKLSVAMCTYNGEDFITEQIDSILNQSLKVDEIVVCDDISTDNTMNIISEYNKKHNGIFKIYRNESNLGSVKNFEKAISLCQGDIVFLCDQDDIWDKKKTQVFVEYFNKNSHINVLASNGNCIDDYNNIIDKYTIWDVPQLLRDKEIAVDYFEMMNFTANIATGASMAIQKTFLDDILPIPTIPDFHHDEWIALKASKINSFEILNDKYFSYRIHENQQVGGVCHDKKQSTINNLTAMFDYRLKSKSLKSHKKLIKKLSKSFRRNNKRFKENIETNSFLKQNLQLIEDRYLQARIEMEVDNPIFGRIINFTDKIFNKRQLKK